MKFYEGMDAIQLMSLMSENVDPVNNLGREGYPQPEDECTGSSLDHILDPCNFPYQFAEFCELLTIPIKGGNGLKGYDKFQFNSSQNAWYEFILDNYADNKRVSFTTIKYRQNGISTASTAFALYAGLTNGYNVAFTAKDDSNKQNLYDMVENYIYCLLKHGISILPRKHAGQLLTVCYGNSVCKLYFRVSNGMGTRGLTLGCLVEDELGHTKNTGLNGSDALDKCQNTVMLGIGTPNGTDNPLYTAFKNGVVGKNVLFIPWHQMQESASETPVEIETDMEDYLEKYNLQNLDIQKKYWLGTIWQYTKVHTFDVEGKINREYPPNIDVGFEASASEVFTHTDYIHFAFKNTNAVRSNDYILGVDVAGNGATSDKFVISIRHGNYATFKQVKSHAGDLDYRIKQSTEIITILRELEYAGYRCLAVNIDTGGLGMEFFNVLRRELQRVNISPSIAQGVTFGQSTKVDTGIFDSRNVSMRTYMYFRLREWLTTRQVFLENIIELKEELIATRSISKDGVESIISKDEIKRNLSRSPDYADALALTFAPINTQPLKFRMVR